MKRFYSWYHRLCFEIIVSERLWKVNSISIQCDGSIGSCAIEQEGVYVTYTNQKLFKPCLKFFKMCAPKDSQDTSGFKDYDKNTCKEHNTESALHKMEYLSGFGMWGLRLHVHTSAHA